MERAENANANGANNKNKAEISIMSGAIKFNEVLFPFSFQLFTRLATVFADEVGGFGPVAHDGQI